MADLPCITTAKPALVTIESFGGMFPVQGFGTVSPFPSFGPPRHWYFRSRGSRWGLAVGEPDAEIGDYVDESRADLYVWGEYGQWPEAGTMPDDDAVARIGWALDLWLAGRRGVVEVPRG